MIASSAMASFPGKNGKIAIVRGSGIWTMNADGSGLTFLTPGSSPAWSPDGSKLALRRGDGIYIANADGTGATRIVPGSFVESPTWSPDGTQLVYLQFGECDFDGICSPNRFIRINSDGTGSTQIHQAQGLAPAWSSNGERIAFHTCTTHCAIPQKFALWTMNPDGSGVQRITDGDYDRNPAWSPHGTRLLIDSLTPATPANFGWATLEEDGTDFTPIGSGIVRPPEFPPATWAPDATRVAFAYDEDCDPRCGGDLYTMKPDGSDFTRLTVLQDVRDADWQPIPINAYPRPRSATGVDVSLVPAYNPCTPPNRQHGPPLAFGSCNPPVKTSDVATVGTPDANGKPAKGQGVARYAAVGGDVRITFEAYDVYDHPTLADYTGELRVRSTLRITDKRNTPHPGGPGAGTVSDASLGATVPCTATGDTTTGSSCLLTTTANAIAPGTVTAGARSVWELGQVQVDDGGPDGDADLPGENTLFLVQGVFVP
jgi:hypothetical protein